MSASSASILVIGASPRMRGTAAVGVHAGEGVRYIPAHSGNGRTTSRPRTRNTVHPRACGERAVIPDNHCVAIGASPRMRGTEGNRQRQLLRRRCIPAHAGNGPTWRLSSRSCAVHPRACGERANRRATLISEYGASPRMRGTGGRRSRRHAVGRCIPAHAGNGTPKTAPHPYNPVHPRACGERGAWKRFGTPSVGASPRMRGTARNHTGDEHGRRCIPAHAGNG